MRQTFIRAGMVFSLLLATAWLHAQTLLQAEPPQPIQQNAEQGTLTAADAVAIALRQNPDLQAAQAGAAQARTGTAQAESAFLPQITFTENATVGDDPVYAFGTRLRQGRFTTEDFALNALNSPGAVGNFMSRADGQWNVFDSFGSVARLHQARSMVAAAQKAITEADQDLILQVLNAYYGWLLAKKQSDVAQQAAATAQALVQSSEARVAAGTAVDADALAAHVNLEMRQQEMIRAQSEVQIARAQMETALGVQLTPGQQPAETLAEQTLPADGLEQDEVRAVQQRANLQAAAAQLDAQRSGLHSARSAFGPHLNLYGSYEADNPNLTQGGSTNWMTGAELRVDIFSRSQYAALANAKARLSQAQAQMQSVQNGVRLQVRRAYYEQDAARQMLDVARAAIAQSQESLRITHDRYDAGLTTMTDLLRAEDAARSSQTEYWQSVYNEILSHAALLRAMGDLSPQSSVVTQ